VPTSQEWFEPGGGGSFWDNQGYVPRPEDKYVDWARQDAKSARGTQERGLGLLGAYARGDKSASRLAAKAALEDTQKAIAARAASAPGGYNPALQRESVFAQSKAGQDIAGQVSAKAAQEQLAAQRAYLQASAAMRGQDIAQQAQEGNWFTQQGQFGLNAAALKQKYLAMGLTDKLATQQALMDLEKLKASQSLGQQGLDLQSFLAAAGQGNNQRDFWMRLLMSGMGGLGQGLGSYYMGQPGAGGGGPNAMSLDGYAKSAYGYDPATNPNYSV
jgi:hypothetical protein